MLVHNVYFYFKPDTTEDQIAKCREMAERLGTISTVKAFYAGTPAPVEQRPVVVTGYGLSITVVFDSVADHDAYQVDPIHLEYVEGNKDLWDKVRVFDSM